MGKKLPLPLPSYMDVLNDGPPLHMIIFDFILFYFIVTTSHYGQQHGTIGGRCDVNKSTRE